MQNEFVSSLDKYLIDHFFVEYQLIDQGLAASKLDGAYLDIETAIDLFDDTVDATLEIPAHAWEQYPVQHHDGSEHQQHDEQPVGQRNGFHSLDKCIRSRCPKSLYITQYLTDCRTTAKMHGIFRITASRVKQ